MANTDFSHTMSQATGSTSGFSKSKAFFTSIHLDLILILLIITLCSLGLVILYSASNQNMAFFYRQLIHFAVGLVALFITAQTPPRIYQTLSPWGYLLSIMMLLGVLFLGVDAKGAKRWLEIPGVIRFQPSELVKLLLPLGIAWYMARKPVPPKILDIAKALVIISIPTVLILKQPDLGTAILILASGFLVLFFAGISWWIIISMLAVVSASLPLLWFFVMHSYQKQRVLTFLNPESDPLGSGWNSIQSKIAIGSGGIEGKGYLQSSQSQLEFLPESHTDFIIAVLAEESGLIGVVLLLLLYGLITLRGLYLSTRCKTLFGRLIAASMMTTFFIYVFVNIGMVSGILPVVGVPLPLISYGGTSVVSLLISFGITMSMATHRH